jgi:hypothetical protein
MRLPPLTRRIAAWLLCALGLGGCGGSASERAFADYLARLARSLDTPADAPLPPRPVDLPGRAALRLELASGELGTLDFLALTGCRVQITIGKRNSSLGRMASASQRLLLALEYLRLAPECIDHLEREERAALAATLRDAWQLHRAQLPALIFNATLGAPEFRQFWRSSGDLGDYPAATSSAVVTALEAISSDTARWLAGDFSADDGGFELQLDAVRRGDGGALMRALALQQAWLQAADELLARHRAERGPLCQGAIRPAAATVVPTVVRKFFIGGIQPWSAAVNRRQLSLLDPLRALERQLASAAPPAYEQWRLQRERQLADWASAPRQHVRALQAFLEPCGGSGLTPAGAQAGRGRSDHGAEHQHQAP